MALVTQIRLLAPNFQLFIKNIFTAVIIVSMYVCKNISFSYITNPIQTQYTRTYLHTNILTYSIVHHWLYSNQRKQNQFHYLLKAELFSKQLLIYIHTRTYRSGNKNQVILYIINMSLDDQKASHEKTNLRTKRKKNMSKQSKTKKQWTSAVRLTVWNIFDKQSQYIDTFWHIYVCTCMYART